jgi:hypothetical protein
MIFPIVLECVRKLHRGLSTLMTVESQVYRNLSPTGNRNMWGGELNVNIPSMS